MNKELKKCKCGCGKDISHKRIGTKFYNKKHKDSYHNKTNPRGYGKYNPLYDLSFEEDKQMFGNDGCNV